MNWIIFFLLFMCYDVMAQEVNTHYHALEQVEIVSKQFESVLDSVLHRESVRPYFQKNLTFQIIIPQKDEIQIRAIGGSRFANEDKGVFHYKGHDFILVFKTWDVLNSDIFLRSDQKIEVPFWKKRWYVDKNGKIIYAVTLDDVMIYVYSYHNGEFIEYDLRKNNMIPGAQ